MHRGPFNWLYITPNRLLQLMKPLQIACVARIGKNSPIKARTGDGKTAHTHLHRLQEPLRVRCQQADKYDVELEWLPYTLRVAEFMGTVEERTPHFWRKVRYAYMDAALCQCAGPHHERPAAHL